MRRGIVLLVLLCSAYGWALAGADNEPALESGPAVGGDMPTPFRPYNVTGAKVSRDKFHSLMLEYSFDPVVLLFVRGSDPDENLITIVKELDKLIVKHQKLRLHAFVVFLDAELKDVVTEDDKRQALTKKLLEKAKQEKLDDAQVPFCLDSANHLKDFKLNDQAEVTALLYRDYKVVAKHVLRKGEAGIEKILSEGVPKLIPAASPKKS